MKNTTKNALIFTLSIFSSLLLAQVSFGQVIDMTSTSIGVVARTPSACVTVDGVRADGQAGTPNAAPYNGGQWFSSVAAASAYMGRTLSSVGTNICATSCTSNATWSGSTCACNTGYGASGATCVALPVCTGSSVNNAAISCPPGYVGTQYTTTTTSCPYGKYGAASTSTSGYNQSGCVEIVTCTPSSKNNPAIACSAVLGPNWSGSAYNTTTTTCATMYSAPSTTTSEYNTSGCSYHSPLVAPAAITYSGKNYMASTNGGTEYDGYVSLVYSTATGNWAVTNGIKKHSLPVPWSHYAFESAGGPVSGTWTNYPTDTYQYKITQVSMNAYKYPNRTYSNQLYYAASSPVFDIPGWVTYNCPPGISLYSDCRLSIYAQPVPASTSADWITMPANSNVTLASAVMANGSDDGQCNGGFPADYAWMIQVRDVAYPSIVTTTVFGLGFDEAPTSSYNACGNNG